MKELFTGFTLEICRLCRPIVKEYPVILLKVAKLLGLMHNNLPPNAVCPQCGYVPPIRREFSSTLHSEAILFRFFLTWVRRLKLTRKTRGWILALYRRQQEAQIE